MRLNPKHPPGRVNRKARAFEPEIGRLRSEGYTCEAIRSALADVGVLVSLSTVQREAAKAKRVPTTAAGEVGIASRRSVATVTTNQTSAPSPFAGPSLTGKEIAAAYVSSRITNPLLRERNSA